MAATHRRGPSHERRRAPGSPYSTTPGRHGSSRRGNAPDPRPSCQISSLSQPCYGPRAQARDSRHQIVEPPFRPGQEAVASKAGQGLVNLRLFRRALVQPLVNLRQSDPAVDRYAGARAVVRPLLVRCGLRIGQQPHSGEGAASCGSVSVCADRLGRSSRARLGLCAHERGRSRRRIRRADGTLRGRSWLGAGHRASPRQCGDQSERSRKSSPTLRSRRRRSARGDIAGLTDLRLRRGWKPRMQAPYSMDMQIRRCTPASRKVVRATKVEDAPERLTIQLRRLRSSAVPTTPSGPGLVSSGPSWATARTGFGRRGAAMDLPERATLSASPSFTWTDR